MLILVALYKNNLVFALLLLLLLLLLLSSQPCWCAQEKKAFVFSIKMTECELQFESEQFLLELARHPDT